MAVRRLGKVLVNDIRDSKGHTFEVSAHWPQQHEESSRYDRIHDDWLPLATACHNPYCSVSVAAVAWMLDYNRHTAVVVAAAVDTANLGTAHSRCHCRCHCRFGGVSTGCNHLVIAAAAEKADNGGTGTVARAQCLASPWDAVMG